MMIIFLQLSLLNQVKVPVKILHHNHMQFQEISVGVLIGIY